MRVQEITAAIELEGLREEWGALFDRCPATPFQSPEWLVPWWRHLGGGDLLVLAARERGRLVGLAPLFLWGIPPEPRQLSFVGAGITDYLDFLLDPDCASEAAQVLLDHLATVCNPWDSCVLEGIRPDSTLAAATAPELDRTVETGSHCPVLILPETWEALLARLRSPVRRSLRKATHSLRHLEGFRIENVEREALTSSRDALFELHRKRWQQRGTRGVLDDERVRRFHAESMSAMFERGRLRLYTLWCADRVAAVTYCLAHRGRTYAYLAGFDPNLGEYSPGAVTLAHAIEHAIHEGMSEFDFLRGQEAYKYDWGACDRETVRITFRRVACPVA